MNKTYAGIGARATPKVVLAQMYTISRKLYYMGYTLYSGGADGADRAFEEGSGKSLIFLPWDGFNNRKVSYTRDNIEYLVPQMNFELVQKYHPKPDKLSAKGRCLMSRNSYQVLGPDLKSPVDFVLCWTKDGKASGGTGQALRIAQDYNIPVFNLKNENTLYDLRNFLIMSN